MGKNPTETPIIAHDSGCLIFKGKDCNCSTRFAPMEQNKFDLFLNDLSEIHSKKAADYTGDKGEFFNFTFASRFASNFDDPMDKVFATILGIKFARLIVLLNNRAEPKNESTEDTFKDIANYVILWSLWRCQTS